MPLKKFQLDKELPIESEILEANFINHFLGSALLRYSLNYMKRLIFYYQVCGSIVAYQKLTILNCYAIER